MATDPDGKDLTVNYPGGSLTMTVGALKSLFGDDTPIITPVPETKQVTVKSHSRVRVIGQPATNVTGFSYEFTQWPTSQANNAASGDVVLLSWEGSEGDWTGRVTGAFSALGIFLVANSTKPVLFRSERGTKYGPFQKGL
jgi:hypothetical protein